MTEEKTHIVIIGSGPGGYVAAIRAAQLGAKVTLIEKEFIGGTCLNVGCIPTKALLEGTGTLDAAKGASRFGIELEIENVHFDKLQEFKDGVVEQMVGGIEFLLKQNGIEVVEGLASIVDNHTVEVNGEQIKCDKLVIATGSTPALPPIEGLKWSDRVIDSTGVLNLKEIPESLVIIGGGVIGCEFASVYNSLGTKVQIIEAEKSILPTMDTAITRMANRFFRQAGIKMDTKSFVQKVEEVDGKVHVTTDKGKEYVGDYLLVATGRIPNTEGLNLEALDIEMDWKFIKVNDKQETSVEDVYAIGDVCTPQMLAHVASAQGEVAVENAMGHEAHYSDKAVPAAVFTPNEIAAVGLTEDQVKEAGIAYKVGEFPLAANSKAVIDSEGRGTIKIIAEEESGKILGAHMIGSRATDLIQELTLAIEHDMTVDDIIQSIHGHPTISEVVREAALDVEKRAIHRM